MDGELNRRLAVLAVLYYRRRTNPSFPEVPLSEIEERMGFPRDYLDFTLWYLQKKGYVYQGGQCAVHAFGGWRGLCGNTTREYSDPAQIAYQWFGFLGRGSRASTTQGGGRDRTHRCCPSTPRQPARHQPLRAPGPIVLPSSASELGDRRRGGPDRRVGKPDLREKKVERRFRPQERREKPQVPLTMGAPLLTSYDS